MAKSYEELKQQAAVIKNETSDGANTAKRIGTMFEDAIDFTDANIGQSVGLIVTDYKGTPEDTRMSVDARFRKKGSVMTYNPGTGYIMEQYIGTTLLDSEWQKGTNWRPYYADENIQNIAEYARSAGEEAQAKGAEAVQIAQTSGEEAKQIAQAAANEASTQAAYAKEQGLLIENGEYLKKQELAKNIGALNIATFCSYVNVVNNSLGAKLPVSDLPKLIKSFRQLSSSEINSSYSVGYAQYITSGVPLEGESWTVISLGVIKLAYKQKSTPSLYFRTNYFDWTQII